MNRYPLWKYAILGVALLIGLLYTVPNFYGEAPAVQVSSGKATIKLDNGMTARVQKVLEEAKLKPDYVQLEGLSVKARFGDTDTQLKAKDAISKALNPDANDPSYRCAESGVAQPRVDGQAAGHAHVPGSGPSRRCALLDAGGHESRADQAG